MANNAIQKRKEEKPKKVFTINTIVYDDGILSGTCIEYRDLGRMKNQKCVVPCQEEFLASVRSIVPSTLPAVEKLTQQIFDDIDVTDVELCEKIGRVVVDVYNDGFVDVDFGEIVQGERGAPKTWRLPPGEFCDMVEARVGQLSAPFKALIEERPIAKVSLNTEPDEGEDVEEELQEDENTDPLEEDTE